MASYKIDTRGLECPIPILKLNLAVKELNLQPKDTLDVYADCKAFEKDLKDWALNRKKTIVYIKEEEDYKIAKILF